MSQPSQSEPNLRPKKNGWEARATVQGRAYSAYGATKQEAAERLEEKVIAYLAPVETDSLKSWMETAYMATIQSRRPATVTKVKWSMTHLGTLANMPLDKIDRKVCQAHINRKAKTHSPGSIRTMVQAWSAAMELAEADGLIRSNPFRHTTLPRVMPKKRDTLTAEESLRLITASRGHSGHALVILGTMMGLRLGEVYGLKAEHFKDGRLIVPGTKSASSAREMPLPIQIHRELAGLPMPLLPKCQTACRNALKRNAARAGITRHVHPHLLRHSFATMLQWLGCPLDIRARLLGHAASRVTQGYSHAEWQEWSKWIELLATHVYGAVGTSLGNAERLDVSEIVNA